LVGRQLHDKQLVYMLGRGIELIKSLVFPTFCTECEVEGELWCAACQNKFSKKTSSWNPNTDTAVTALRQVTALSLYDESGPIAACIQALKYNFQTDTKNMWERFLVFPRIDTNFVCIPVPLYPRRLRERGFNQAEFLARLIAKNHGLEVDTTGLVRTRATKQQVRLKKEERLVNMHDAFAWTGASVSKKIYLVDDVYTTGATMQACAKALLAAGAQCVEGLVVARG